MQLRLRRHFDSIKGLSLSDGIQAIAKLAPDLTTSVTPTGQPLIEHPGYDGSVDLSEMATLYLLCAARCLTEHASFEVRLRHVSLEQTFTALYRKANAKFVAGYKDGSIVPEERYEVFGCWSGRTGTVIAHGLHEGIALFFHELEYRQIWGSEAWQDSMFLWNDDTEGKSFALRASIDQVEEAMAQSSSDGPSIVEEEMPLDRILKALEKPSSQGLRIPLDEKRLERIREVLAAIPR